VTAGLPRPGRVFGQFQYLSPPLEVPDEVTRAALKRLGDQLGHREPGQ